MYNSADAEASSGGASQLKSSAKDGLLPGRNCGLAVPGTNDARQGTNQLSLDEIQTALLALLLELTGVADREKLN